MDSLIFSFAPAFILGNVAGKQHVVNLKYLKFFRKLWDSFLGSTLRQDTVRL